MANRRRLLWLPSLLLALVFALPGTALARRPLGPPPPIGVLYTVTSLADGGSTPGECTLREAITSANGGASDCGLASPAADDEIEFAVGGALTLNGDLPAIDGNLTIDSADQVTIDAVNTYRIFTVNSGKTLVLTHIDLMRGQAANEGGAIRSLGSLYVTDVSFTSNNADAGGGAIYSYGVSEIHQSYFINNTGANGGAILNPGILLLEGSTFEENYSNLVDPASRGGAVWSSGLLIIQGGQFIRNLASGGGAIYARQEVDTNSLTITGAAFHRNRALAPDPDGNGGALLIDNLPATIQASTFISNGAAAGGAIYLDATGVLTLTNSTLHNNSDASEPGLNNKPTATLSSGGGLYNKGTAHLTNVTLSANDAVEGSGIDNYGLLFLTNVTLSGNDATGDLAALRNEAGGTARLSNVTLSGNAGGGIMNLAPDAHLNLTNVIVADSHRGDNCAFFTPPDLSQFNLSSDNTCNFGGGRNNLDLRLGPLANNGGSTQTHLPRCSSPAIENGTDDDAPSVDQRGFGRPQGTFYDVGSVEVRPAEGMRCLYLSLLLR